MELWEFSLIFAMTIYISFADKIFRQARANVKFAADFLLLFFFFIFTRKKYNVFNVLHVRDWNTYYIC